MSDAVDDDGDLVVRTARLELVSLGPRVLEALLRGALHEVQAALGVRPPPEWVREERWLLQLRLADVRARPSAQPWLLRAVVVREGRLFAGHFNFHGPPDSGGRVELGYTVLPAHRRRGYATEAAVGMMRWASERHGVGHFRACVSPSNVASLGMVRALGFRQVGTQWDALDGEERVFEHAGVPAAAREGRTDE